MLDIYIYIYIYIIDANSPTLLRAKDTSMLEIPCLHCYGE